MTTAWARWQPFLRGTAAVAAAMAAGNVLGYTLNLVAARSLGPREYGALASMLALVLIGYVASLGVQTVTARRVAAGAGQSQRDALRRTAVAVSLAAGLVAAAVAPLVAGFLHLGSVSAPFAVAATLIPLTWGGFLQGLAQGEERFGRLAATFLLMAVGKVGGSLVVLLAGGSTAAIMWGSAAGTTLAAGAATVGASRLSRDSAFVSQPSTPAVEVAHVIHALFALFLLTNLDLLLARHYLSQAAAGQYAAGAVITKIAFWLPQFVGVVAFPRLADPKRRDAAAKVAVLSVAAVGLVLSGGVALMGDLAVFVVAGPDYASLAPHAWWFAVLGSLLALAQVLLYARLAQQDRRAAATVWAAVVVETGVVALVAHGSVVGIVATACATVLALVVMGLLVSLPRSVARRRRAAAPAQPAVGQGPGL
jgi:O-antigen/teichoic acid export membrane protein